MYKKFCLFATFFFYLLSKLQKYSFSFSLLLAANPPLPRAVHLKISYILCKWKL
jgi:hypothetical protein